MTLDARPLGDFASKLLFENELVRGATETAINPSDKRFREILIALNQTGDNEAKLAVSNGPAFPRGRVGRCVRGEPAAGDH